MGCSPPKLGLNLETSCPWPFSGRVLRISRARMKQDLPCRWPALRRRAAYQATRPVVFYVGRPSPRACPLRNQFHPGSNWRPPPEAALTLESLRAAGSEWRIASTSRSLEGLLSAVSAGLAVPVITRSMLREGLREIEPEGPAGLPPLPQVEIALHRSPGRPSEPIQKLTDLILESL